MAQDLLFIESIETKKQELYGVRKETRMMKKAVFVSACRTAIGAFGGTLKDVPAAELGAIVVKEAVSRAGIKPEQVDEVIFGNVLQAGLGQNVARQVTLKAGLPIETTAMTINIVCGSGLKSVALAANQILAGESEIVVCGGTENMSAAPYAIPSATVPRSSGKQTGRIIFLRAYSLESPRPMELVI